MYEQPLQRFERTRNENNKPWTKGILPLTIEESQLYHKQKVSYIYKNKISTDDKKVRNHCHFNGKHRRAAHNACNLNYKASKESPLVFHNGSSYDYHLIIKEPAKEIKESKCLGENTERYITFSVPVKNDKGKKYKIRFIDGFRLMSTSLSNLVDNLSDRLHSVNCTDCKTYLDYMSIKDDHLIFRCFECKQNYMKDFNKDLIKIFGNIYEFCKGDINKFILLFRKIIYPYECMDSWERFD